MTHRTPFHDLDAYVALPRLGGLVLSPDGRRLVTTVTTLNPDRTAYASALWELDPGGERPARRLTRSAKGEAAAAFAATGDLLFTSARPDPDGEGKGDDQPKSALWLLPAGGGEARVIATAPGGLSGILCAREATVISVAASVLPSADDLLRDATLRKARTEAKVAAILHSGYPVRDWDHDLGPDQSRRYAAELAGLADEPAQPLPKPEGDHPAGDGPAPGRLALRQLTGAGRALRSHSAALSPDGATLVTTWIVPDRGAAERSTLVAIDVTTGERRTLVDDPGTTAGNPALSADGTQVAFVRSTLSTPEHAPREQLMVVPLAGGTPRPVAAGWDRWPTSVSWLPDGSALVVTADDNGRGPIHLVGLDDGTVEPVTGDDAVYTDLQIAPDGTLYALRTSYTAPATPVRIDLPGFLAGGPAGARRPIAAEPLRSPAPAPSLPGELREIETAADDGTRVRGWLALPDGASADNPAPLLLWIHGGPLSSWNAWSWRWNPWLMAAQGYAVLLPDPALSTGYGQDFVQRGWGRWGAEPYTDLMAITDATEALPEIDQTRVAAMGGSFGGYMANWVAGHTDRFRAIVTHASLWALDQFGPTTDYAYYWQREMTPEMALANSPHRLVDQIRTPMLVIHGDRDYRVPIGEGLRLWYELLTASGLPAADDGSTVHRFLYFPDENHWVLTPQHAKVWYQTVGAFLAEHLLGTPGRYPESLG
ncbi:MAG: S9 family peptidase [Propionibacteriaceae bacterium]|nr:S9 family peptidase [Propionibacteriaceae bacterium]